MNYVYNIKVNLKNKLYNFYEWDHNDKIELFNRLDVFVVNDETYNEILKMNIKVDNEFLEKIKINKLTCIFTNDIDTVCTRFNKDGIIKYISKLDLEEEMELLDEINLKDKCNLKYKTINNTNNYSFNTREEDDIIDSLRKYLIDNKDNNELIDFLYDEWFKDNKKVNKYDRLLESINSEYTTKHKELYDLIKLIV